MEMAQQHHAGDHAESKATYFYVWGALIALTVLGRGGGDDDILTEQSRARVDDATDEIAGAIVRIVPGSNPPETTLTENFNIPMPGFGPRGGDIDKQGRVWVSLASGHMGVFDRRLCKGPLNGPKATGDHCPEGWAFHQYPGPGFKGIGENSAEASYYSWVDQHNTFGLGDDIPMSTNNSDSLHVLKDGTFIQLRVPYPMGFFAKGLDGRIDDPNAGWKGRGLWSTYGNRTPFHNEGGKGTKPLAAHFQLRPDPLAH